MENYITDDIESKALTSKLNSYKNVYLVNRKSPIRKWLYGILLLLVVVAFLPWTQNIRAKGIVTTVSLEQRPQELNTVIAGKVVKWYVKEGDFIKAGDTILQLGEVKVEYFDPQLLARTQEQIIAKQQANLGYENKAQTAETQVNALTEGKTLKLAQLENKVKQQYLKIQADSTDLLAVNNEYSVSKRQIDAAKLMLDSGVISLTDYERRKLSFQNSIAKKISTESKYLQSKQELSNLFIEKNSIEQDYKDKISKASGDIYSSRSSMATGAADVSKLQNLYSNYDIRQQLYYIKAPQEGQIRASKKAGIGEMVKEGEMIVEIVPTNATHAIELFIEPMDLPLISKGQKVRFVFDGFPAIVFSGWPNANYGTFGGKVSAIETSVSANGKFRILVIEDSNEKKWPKQLSIGGGANGIALLKDVSIWYELWRNINGFPPEYYQAYEEKEAGKQAKKK
jgi:multidrug efflux pump subunit AcrA (membrane-fusion protein)